jgi:hypothetical protein
VLAKYKERLSVNKQGLHKFHMEKFNFRKLYEIKRKEKFHVEVPNRFSALEDWTMRLK